MNQPERAYEILVHFDESQDIWTLQDFPSYAYFDARLYPLLMAVLESQGITPRKPREIPYRCRSGGQPGQK